MKQCRKCGSDEHERMKITPKQYAVLLYETTKHSKGTELSRQIKDFLQLLTRNRALALLPRIERAYVDYYNARESVVDVEVTTAREVPDIKKLVAQTFRSDNVRAKALSYTFVVNPEVLGGARIRAGDYMIDDTLKARLTQLKRTMYGR